MCSEFFDIGPFRFECDLNDRSHVLRRTSGFGESASTVVEHRSSSPRMAGDCEVTWYTEVVDSDAV